MAYLAADYPLPISIVWLIIPMTFLTIGGILITEKILIPRFLVCDRPAIFAILLFLLSYAINIAAIFIEYFYRKALGLPPSVFDPFSFWTYIDDFISGLLLVFLLAGFSLWTLYDNFQRQEKEEKELKTNVEEKIKLFRSRVDMMTVREMLDKAIGALGENTDRAESMIRDLSDYLRKSLYSDRRERDIPFESTAHSVRLTSRAMRFITERRYRVARHICLLFTFALLGAGMFFDYPNQPVFDAAHLIQGMVLFLILTLLSYLNIYFIFPRFLRRGNQKRYVRNFTITISILYLVLVMQGYAGKGYVNPAGIAMPWFVVLLATAGYLLTFVFLFIGTASLLLIKKNLTGKWRVSRLETELARTEFEILQAQVNPHFLFNVLNNACILSYDEPEEAKKALEGVKEFLEYMMEETERRETTVRREAQFITNYLAMEKSSGRQLDFSVYYDEWAADVRIPVLMLIPLVENATKHSCSVDGKREINVRFQTTDSGLEFICTNTCRDESSGLYPLYHIGNASGLGLYNTRRRLQLLSGDRFIFSTQRSHGIFIARLQINLDKEI